MTALIESKLGMVLREAVNSLTRETTHRILVESADGEVARFVRRAPLLGQLRVAKRPSMEAKNGGGSGGDGGSAAPLSLDAHDLLEEIEEEATRQWWILKSVTRETRKPVFGPQLQQQPQTQRLPVELRIQFWAARAHLTAGGVEEAVKITGRWVREIEALFDPVHRRELAGSCPECGARFVQVQRYGELVRASALTAAWSAGGGAVASCAGCAARWSGIGMHALAEHVNPTMGTREGSVVNPG